MNSIPEITLSVDEYKRLLADRCSLRLQLQQAKAEIEELYERLERVIQAAKGDL